MPEGLPRHNLLTESLTGFCQYIGALEESITSDSHQLSSANRYSSMSSKPSLQRPDRNTPLSTHPHTHPCTTRRRFGHNKGGSLGLSEGLRGGDTSCTMILDTSFGSVTKGRAHPVPNRQKMWVSVSTNWMSRR